MTDVGGVAGAGRGTGAAAAGPAGPQVVSSVLVGRDGELGLLTGVLAGPPAVAVIEGEAGIGKTRLLAALADHSELAGRRWLAGGCRPVREPFPLGPVVEAVRGLERELRGAGLSPVAGSLRPLLPELEAVLPLAPPPLGDRAAERHRVFRGLAELLGALCPVVLAVEDLHWADEQTLEFLGYLRARPPERLCLVVTLRGEEGGPGIRVALGRPAAGVARERVVLGPLDAGQTGVLAASILGTGRVSGEFAARLWERSSGVPLAVEELLALLVARGSLVRLGGRWARSALEELDVPAGIADPVLERLAGLPAPARQVAEASAVLQMAARLPVLAAVSGISAASAARGAGRAVAAGLLAEQGEAVGFRHVLAGQAVYAALWGSRRRRLHGRAAAALERLDPVLGKAAMVLIEVGDPGWRPLAHKLAEAADGRPRHRLKIAAYFAAGLG